MSWGDRALEAEVLDARNPHLSLGDAEHDTFVIAGGAQVKLSWRPEGVEVLFSLGISGQASLGGAPPANLSALVERGVIAEEGPHYRLRLARGDSLALEVAGQRIEVRPAKARVARLQLDLPSTLALVTALVLLAAWIVVSLRDMTPLNLLGP